MIPINLNAEELLRWQSSARLDLWDTEIMMRRLADELGKALDELAECPDEGVMEKRFEVQLEQSEFRAQLLTEILELCEQHGSKAELVKAIKLVVENSFVEL
jgi:hypothetical protein